MIARAKLKTPIINRFFNLELPTLLLSILLLKINKKNKKLLYGVLFNISKKALTNLVSINYQKQKPRTLEMNFSWISCQ
jgi:hypothetical protein